MAAKDGRALGLAVELTTGCNLDCPHCYNPERGGPGLGPEALVELLRDWTQHLDLPRLGAYGVRGSDVERVVEHSRGSSMRTNPIELTDEEIAALRAEKIANAPILSSSIVTGFLLLALVLTTARARMELPSTSSTPTALSPSSRMRPSTRQL